MALTGIRDISTIDSAPEIRKSVQSFVVQFDWTLVRDAILNEMNRGGQVYFVCRKIMQMDPLLKELHERIPEAKVICAHGRMSEEESERNMSAFIEHEYDVLLCTTIVESGIDIPSVNTMIIYEADKFGLAQLYQLRGRIGRSSYQAYAYFTHFAEDVASDSARKRLEAIKEFTNLGSGMKIAMRDLQIRGAGNILGAEQSGHMASIGYSLYVKMVKEAVMSSLGQAEHQKVESTVNLGLNAYIPNDYIVDENLKIYTYKQIYNLDSVKRGREIRDELQEKFGSVPVEVQNLIITSIIRSFAEKAGLSSVVRQGDVLILRFSKDVTVDSVMLIDLLSETKGKAEIRNGKETYLRYGHKTGRRYDDFLQFLKSLSDCISISNQV
jgi:transcription-repair coupling factor (superfamily II helicase)